MEKLGKRSKPSSKVDIKDPNENPNQGKSHYKRKEAFVDFQYKNVYFDAFYKHCLSSDFEDDEEFEHFLTTIKDHLPITFRVNASYPNHSKVFDFLQNSEFIKTCFSTAAEGVSEEQYNYFKKRYGTDLKNVKLKKVPWYPRKLVYMLNMSKRGLRKSKGLKKFHRMIQAASECGMFVRQELVSMLPPLFLDLNPNDLVLDMCAAPGSKTSQILEIMNMKFEEMKNKGEVGIDAIIKGGVVANDMDEKRAFMLAHRVNKIDTTGLAVINHEGQKIPDVFIDEEKTQKMKFDKVMVDVPCSGDGAIRKLPKRWRLWDTKDGISLHHVQIKLLKRAVELCKVGGRVVYSTCSLNPVENEAVITEVLRISETINPGGLKLIEAHDMLEEFRGRRGLNSWDVLLKKNGPHPFKDIKESYEMKELFHVLSGKGRGDKFKIKSNTDDERQNIQFSERVKDSMFPLEEKEMNKLNIGFSMRVMPHDQNTGGFFVAVFEKKGEVDFGVLDEEEMQEKAEKEYIRLREVSPLEVERIQEYYGIEEEKILNHIFVHKEGERKLRLVSEKVAQYFENDRDLKLKRVNLGSRILQRQRGKKENNNLYYRITQSGAESLIHNISKRKYEINLDEMMYLAKKRTATFQEISSKFGGQDSNSGLIKISGLEEVGYFIVYVKQEGYQLNNGIIECGVIQKFPHSLAFQVSLESSLGFKIKYNEEHSFLEEDINSKGKKIQNRGNNGGKKKKE